ncbi:MAG: MFS transporter [Alphaproteobacteria bacterium]|nr:MFS transporter [Alphaproteobacteria bacterium]
MTGAGPAPLPRGVWALGLVSLLMDLSSEMIHGLLPVYLVVVLGLGATSLGLIEGLAEATAAFLKVFSGALSDRMGRRKPLALAGYGLAALAKPLFPLAQGLGLVVTARMVDRIGKGLRGAPRDALVADLTPEAQRGAAYGLRQTLDTVGALLGPLVAVGLMLLSGDDYRFVFWCATIPAILCVLVLAFGVSEPPTQATRPARVLPRLGDLGAMGGAFWGLMAVATLLHFGRFSEAFLLLRLKEAGLAEAYVPLGLVVMNLIYAAGAYPAGMLSDRVGRRGLLYLGIGVGIAAQAVLAFNGGVIGVLIGIVLWGAGLALTQGLLAAMIADAAPPDRRGTAFGVFHMLTGLALLPASLLAGGLWDAFGPTATFAAGAGITALALIGLAARPNSKVKTS